MNGNSVTSKDVLNWQATQNQAFKVHFSLGGNLKRNIACKDSVALASANFLGATRQSVLCMLTVSVYTPN